MVNLTDFNEALIGTPIFDMSLDELKEEFHITEIVKKELEQLLLELGIRRVALSGRIGQLVWIQIKESGK